MVEERFEFRSSTKNNLLKFIVAGLVLSVIGVVLMNLGGAHAEHEAVAEGHHGFAWYKRLYTNIWINNVYFTGVAVVGVFFFALQYVAQAGWSVGIKRIAMSFGSWLPIAGILMLVSFLAFSHDIFHWTHHSLYEQGADYDAIIDGKSGFFFWPLHAGGFPLFFILRMVAFFGLWYWLFRILQKYMLAEDIEGGTQYWYTM
ncbi:MAG: quinol:cytochrome C oxidoreductase, partial [Cyclobacteriaceae bacterium]